MAGHFIPVCTCHGFGRTIHVIDPALVIGRNDAFGYGLQRVLRLPLAPAQRHFQTLAITDVTRDGQNGGIPPKFDGRTLCLDPKSLLVAIDQLNLETSRDVLAGQPFGC